MRMDTDWYWLAVNNISSSRLETNKTNCYVDGKDGNSYKWIFVFAKEDEDYMTIQFMEEGEEESYFHLIQYNNSL